MSKKEKLAIYLPPDLREELQERYTEDGSPSLTVFVEKSIRFYLDYLMYSDCGTFLPNAVKSCIEGRLDIFEDRMAKLLFKLSVEHDMSMRITAGTFNIDEDYLRRTRAKAISDIKQTNGMLSFENIIKEDE